jgi:anaerobic magnesium-protoporphyrin IX monomethyl ester cyclase
MRYKDRQILLIAPEILNNRSMPCVGLGYIGAYLASKGMRVRIIDSQFRKEDPFKPLQAAASTLVGISVDSRTIQRGLKIARFAKAHGHTTMLGGLHVSLIKEDIMNHPEVDYAIVGDGEAPSHQLVQALDGERPMDTVSGLIFRHPNGSIQRVLNSSEEENLDELPPPDYTLAGVRNIRLYPLLTSRDCPYSCSYCTVGHISHGRFRARSAVHAVNEIDMAKERYGIKGFIVVDENFAFRISRAVEFCQILIDRKTNLPWTAFEGVRAECLNEEFLFLLRASHCRWIFFGIETVENAVLKNVQKGNRFSQIQRAADLARSYGFRVGGFLIIGLPGSSFQTDMQTVDWATRHLDKCTFWSAIPYHGTSLYNWVLEHGRLLRDPTGPNLINSLSTMPFFETPDYPAHDRKRAHTIANLRTGVRYFLEPVEYDTQQRLGGARRVEDYTKRSLVQLAARYDPYFLPQLVAGRRFPAIEDPVEAAVDARASEEQKALPSDLLGNLGTPTWSISRPVAGDHFPILEEP